MLLNWRMFTPKTTKPMSAYVLRMTPMSTAKCSRSGSALATVRVTMPKFGWKCISLKMRNKKMTMFAPQSDKYTYQQARRVVVSVIMT
eukprot:9504117-Pyramimonas_sp.AAC.2